MLRPLLILHFIMATVSAYAQREGNVLLGTQMDLIKSDYDVFFNKVQIGLEANYFIHDKFSTSAGIEIWSREALSGVVGFRYYPDENVFLRMRGLLGANDLSIGGGFAKPLSEYIRMEALTDFYFEGSFSIRLGFAYILTKK